VERVYGVDRNDPTCYDLVINLEQISLPAACAIVAEVVQRDFQTTPESQRVVDDLTFASAIRAKISIDRDIADDVLEIEVKDGVVTITGTVRSLNDADRVRALVKAMPGVKRIESKMGTRW
jgi:osmotically-inducible protein OsmY